jgi:hypothetical protein
MPAETAATPKPWRNPFGEACGPSRSAAAITACTARLHLADAVHQFKRIEQGRWDGHGAVDPRLALLHLEHQHAGGEVDTVGGERECFGQAAAGKGQGHAEGAHQAVGTLCFPKERLTLAGGDVFPGFRAMGGVEPQPSEGGQGRLSDAVSAPTPLRPECPAFVGAPSPRSIPVAAATLGVSEPGERVNGGAGVRVGIEADAALGANAAPLAGEERAAEQVGPDCQAVVAPLIALGADTSQRGLIGEQQQLERLGHRTNFRRVGMIQREVYQIRSIRRYVMGRRAREYVGRRAVLAGQPDTLLTSVSRPAAQRSISDMPKARGSCEGLMPIRTVQPPYLCPQPTSDRDGPSFA